MLAILKAAHCRSTHHHFAIDALRHLATDDGRKLARFLLRHHSGYLAGAKDPDTRFRDFQNHVLHVADSHWGGAPRAVERWYGRAQQFLRQEAWSDAAHAIGVLSHYFTDPLQPLHTGQSDREAIVHRPLEWSICKSYSSIRDRWREGRFRVIFQLSSQPDWLAAAVTRGAELAHQSYETLVSTYDLDAARSDPRAGLSEASLEALAELFGVAIVGWARVLDRAAMEAEGHIPTVDLSTSALLATIKIPFGLLLRRLELQRERQAVLDLLDYYHRFGVAGPHLPQEVKLIRKVLAVREKEQQYRSELENTHDDGASATDLRVVASDSTDAQEALEDHSTVSPAHMPRSRLSLTSPIVDAPSIGPKTAARLKDVGVSNISQLLGANPEDLVARLRVGWIGVEQIADWQAQTRLLMALPSLRVRDVQMLVGCGCRTLQLLATSDSNMLLQKIIRHAATSSGKRFLRGAKPPTKSELEKWIQLAQDSLAEDRSNQGANAA